MSGVFGYTLVQAAALLFAGASSLIGIFIGYLAYRGLKRNHSQRMMFLATGMILLFGVAYGVSLLGTLLLHFRILPLPAQDPFRLVIRVIQFTALVCIAYSLYLDPEKD